MATASSDLPSELIKDGVSEFTAPFNLAISGQCFVGISYSGYLKDSRFHKIQGERSLIGAPDQCFLRFWAKPMGNVDLTSMHNISISSIAVESALKRRGKQSVFGAIDMHTTALIVVDMQNCFLEPGAPGETPSARLIVGNINRLAHAMRDAGSKVIWLRHTVTEEAAPWSRFLDFQGTDHGKKVNAALTPGHPGHEIYPQMNVEPSDLLIDKTRFSPFVEGSSVLHQKLRDLGADTVVIVGAVTNICCESTARDAMMLNYMVHFVADANAARSDEAHNATLSNMVTMFGDVRSTDELIGMIPVAA